MKNIVLFGAPGCGKGTQAKKLVEKYGFNHISTGEIIRNEIKDGSPIGLEIKEHIEQGGLAPDSLVIEIVAEYMESHNEGVGNVFDGFPRTALQAEEFDRTLARHNLKVDVMFDLDVNEEELVKRIIIRGEDSCRADDCDEDVILKRIAIYKAQTAVVADYYATQNKFVHIDGAGSVDDIFERICVQVEKLGVYPL